MLNTISGMPKSASDHWPTASGAVRASTPNAVSRKPAARRFNGAAFGHTVTPPKSLGTDRLVSGRNVGAESCLKKWSPSTRIRPFDHLVRTVGSEKVSCYRDGRPSDPLKAILLPVAAAAARHVDITVGL